MEPATLTKALGSCSRIAKQARAYVRYATFA
jgi:hypothetical protein